MPRIDTIEELMQVLDEHPQWLEALRTRLLTRELIELPRRFAEFSAAVDQNFARAERRMDGMERTISGMSQRMDGMERTISGMSQRMDGMEQTMGEMSERMDSFATKDQQRPLHNPRIDAIGSSAPPKPAIRPLKSLENGLIFPCPPPFQGLRRSSYRRRAQYAPTHAPCNPPSTRPHAASCTPAP